MGRTTQFPNCREGEAISWHLLDILNKKRALKDKAIERVVFNAVTKDAIREAMAHPRQIDQALVDAYLARRALDYLVGFTLSPVLCPAVARACLPLQAAAGAGAGADAGDGGDHRAVSGGDRPRVRDVHRPRQAHPVSDPVLVVLVTAVKAAAQYFQNVQVQQIVLLVIRELQGRMFAHLTRTDLTRMEREAPAQLAARFTTDAATIREALTRAVNGLADAVTVVGLVASMLYLDWLLSLIGAVLYPLAAVPIQRIGKRVRRASGGMQERMGETAALLNESFAQARTVRAYRLEDLETRRAEGAFAESTVPCSAWRAAGRDAIRCWRCWVVPRWPR